MYDLYGEISEYLGTNDPTQIFRTTTRAVEYLATKGEWDCLKGYVDLPISASNFVVLPSQVETPLKFTIDNIPAFSRDRLYEFTLNGFGSNPGADRVDHSWEDRGFIPTQIYIPSTPSGFWLAVAPSNADQGARIFIRGFDPNNNERTETLVIDPVNFVQSVGLYSQITEINKEQTQQAVPIYRWSQASQPPGPPNDLFANAQPVSGLRSNPGFPVIGTTQGASIEPGEPSPSAISTVWYQWMGIKKVVEAFYTRRDYFIDVYQGATLDALTYIGSSTDNGTTSLVQWGTVAGQLYYIRVRPPSDLASGSFTLGWFESLSVSGAPEPLPPDNCPDYPPTGSSAPGPIMPPQNSLMPGSLLVGCYEQNDLNPRFRLIRLSLSGTTARFLFRRKVFKIVSMDDFIPIQSELGLLTMVQSIQALRRKDLEIAKAMADSAVEITTDAQRATTGFIELANQTEVQDARNYNIYNRDTVIMLDVFDDVAKILGNVGEFNIFDATTTGLEVLNSKGHWDGLTGYVDILTDGRRNVTLPRFVDEPVAISINGRPAYMRNKWSEFHLNGPGSDEFGGQYMGGTWQSYYGIDGGGRWGQVRAWDSVGEVVTIRSLESVSQLVAIPDLQADDGKLYRIYGYDETGKWIRQNGMDGFAVVVDHTKLLPDINIDQKVAQIERITRDSTQGFVRLWAFDAVTQTTSVLLGYHYPDETEPKYFRIKIPVDASWVRMRYRKRTLKVTSVWQPLHLHSRMAITTMVRSLAALDSKDPNASQIAEGLDQKATKFLDEDQRARNPGESFQLQIDENLWNSNYIVS